MGAAVMGVDAITIIVEVNVSMGQGYQIVGLPDIAIKESLQRTETYLAPLNKLIDSWPLANRICLT